MTTQPPPDSPEQLLAATPPGFGPPSHQQPTADPLDPAVTTVTEGPAPVTPEPEEESRPGVRERLRRLRAAGGAGVGEAAFSTPPIPRLGPSQVFTPDPEAFVGVIATAVGLASFGVNHKLSPDTGAWMADEVTANDIAAPLARIAARHIKLADKGAANDLSDGLEAAVATVGYVVTSSQRDAAAHRPDPRFEPANQPPE